MIVLALCFIIWKFEVLYFQAVECRRVIQPDKEYIGGHESIYYVSSHSSNYLGGGVRALSKFHSVEVSDSKMIMTFPNLQLAVHLHSEGFSRWKLWHLVYGTSIHPVNTWTPRTWMPRRLTRRLTRRLDSTGTSESPNLDSVFCLLWLVSIYVTIICIICNGSFGCCWCCCCCCCCAAWTASLDQINFAVTNSLITKS